MCSGVTSQPIRSRQNELTYISISIHGSDNLCNNGVVHNRWAGQLRDGIYSLKHRTVLGYDPVAAHPALSLPTDTYY